MYSVIFGDIFFGQLLRALTHHLMRNIALELIVIDKTRGHEVFEKNQYFFFFSFKNNFIIYFASHMVLSH